jgi:spore maturation protein CgeB
MMFGIASETGLGVSMYDRNSSRKSKIYRVSVLPNMDVKPSVRHDMTAQIYKEYLVSLNVNTIEDSPTMFSRRLIEIIACGGIAVTNPSPAVEKYFKDFCHVVSNKEEMTALFERLKNGPSKEDLERARAGAEYIAREHTWAHRINEISAIIGIKSKLGDIYEQK